jgi:hypothetical protein
LAMDGVARSFNIPNIRLPRALPRHKHRQCRGRAVTVNTA